MTSVRILNILFLSLAVLAGSCSGSDAEQTCTGHSDCPEGQECTDGVCVPPVDSDGDGYSAGQGDCDDSNAEVHPGANEVPYDGLDNDCDPSTPDDDLDGDGYDSDVDCDDDDVDINPGQDEVCYDGLDNDCSVGTRDDDCDGDGYAVGEDCNDVDADIYPGAPEGCQDGIDQDCDGNDFVLDCGTHGQCDDGSGTAVCTCDTGYSGASCETCDTGYQDNDNNNTCLPDCTTAGLSCGTYGTCDDSSGNAQCVCETGHAGESCESCDNGYQDNDSDGTCLPDCTTAGLGCGDHGNCSDSSGSAVCVCDSGYAGMNCETCDTGYQDNDSDGTCLPDCTTAGLSCGTYGTCDDSSGNAQCVCETGHAGDNCESCGNGYQDNDSDGTCLPDCTTAGLGCGSHGNCSDSSGSAICVCDSGYSGMNCETCDTGYQDNDNNSTCLPDCTTAGLSCGIYSSCDDSSGLAQCLCDEGYSGVNCDTCDTGYQDNDSNGSCLPDCQNAGLACDSHEHCDDSSGAAQCVCDTGYTGANCDTCDTGYQDNDLNGTCEPDCSTAGLACGGNGHCDDSSGAAICICDAGYQDNDMNGTCEPDCVTAGLTCSGHGSCDDSSGVAFCICDVGYAGINCETCDTGYQDNDVNGTCEPTCQTAGYDCSGHGTCDDSSGVAFCICDVGYAGTRCETCDTGYQDNDINGTCEPNCLTAGYDCSGHGTCEDSSGFPVCNCEYGYQDNDADGTCLLTCDFATPDCPENAHCDDISGEAICVCDQGYQDNDLNGTCLVDCSTAGIDCGANGQCDDSIGIAFCDCYQGFGGTCDSYCEFDIGSGLIAHYLMEDDLQDSSGNTYQGFGQGTMLYGNDPFGYPSSLVLDGSSDVLLPASMENDLTSAVQATFAAWVRWDTLDDSTVVFAFGNNLESTGVSRAGMTDAIRFWVGANTIEGGVIATGAWSHVVAVVGPQGMRLYLDGFLVGDDPNYTDPMFPSPGTSYFLGRSTNPDPRYLNGALDDVRIYRTALNSNEVIALYNSGYYDHRTSEDWDGDGVLNDGDGSGVIGDQPCAAGTTSSCDDNAVMCPNPEQRLIFMSCADISATVDGLYTIDPDGAGGNPAFTVYCADMATAEPKEYLELVVTGGMNNYSYYVYTSGSTAATCNYDKVRFDDIFALRIDRSDQRFATCTGNASYFASARWGEASSCMCSGCSNGRMNIDLTGTPFKIDYAGGAGWETVGYHPGGSITRDDGPGIIIEATGGGYCGTTRPIIPPGLILTFQ